MKKLVILILSMVLVACSTQPSQEGQNEKEKIDYIQVYNDAYEKLAQGGFYKYSGNLIDQFAYTIVSEDMNYIQYDWFYMDDQLINFMLEVPNKNDPTLSTMYLGTRMTPLELFPTSDVPNNYEHDFTDYIVDEERSYYEDNTYMMYWKYQPDLDGLMPMYGRIEFVVEDGILASETYTYYDDSTYARETNSESAMYIDDAVDFEKEYDLAYSFVGKGITETEYLCTIEKTVVEPLNPIPLVSQGELELVDVNNHYEYNLSLKPEKMQVVGNAKITFTSNFDSDYYVIRDYLANYDRETIYSNVKSNKGNVTVERDKDPTIVYFKLDEGISKDEEITVEFSIEIPYSNTVQDEYGYNEEYNTYSLGYSLPILAVYENGEFIAHPMVSYGEPAYSDLANYDVSITVPNGYIVAGTGKLEVSGNTYSFKAECVRDVAYMMSDQYYVTEGKLGDTKIIAYGYDQDQADLFYNDARDCLSNQNHRFVNYPYEQLSVVAWNFYNGAGGKEYPQLIQIGMSMSRDYTYQVIYHEIAHQYFYGIVGNDQYNEAWLDETLASYVTSRRAEFYPVIITKAYNKYETSESYSNSIYTSGNNMFYALEDRYGLPKMNEMLQTYILTYGFKNVKSVDLVYCMKEVLGDDCYDIIEPYISSAILEAVFN